MSPRRYSLGKRAAATAETRGRILAAIVALHGEKGVAATTAADVAARADVAVGTVTRYFPSLEHMVHACGAHLMATLSPPQREIFDGLDELDERLRVLIRELFAFYERGARWFRVGYPDADRVEALAQSIERQHEHRASLVREALEPFDVPRDAIHITIAILSYPAWQALIDAGMRSGDAAVSVGNMLLAWLRHPAHIIHH